MRTKMRERKLPKLLAATLAVVMVLMYAIPTSVAYADYQEVVTYSHSGGTKRVTESDNNTYVVYCTQASRSPSSAVGTDADKREKYFWNAAIKAGDIGAAYANPLVYLLYLNEQDSSPGNYQFTVDDWNIDPVGGNNPVNADVDTSGNYALGLKHLILKTLYYGYPYNKGDGTYSEAETQSAIYWCIYAGKNGGSDTSSYYNNLVKEVLSNNAFETQFPSWWDLSMYIYLPTNDARKAGMTEQALIRATYEIGPYVSNTTVNANGSTPSDAVEDDEGKIIEEEKPAEVEIEKGDKVTVKDTVVLNGLTAGEKYSVEWEVVKTDGTSVKKDIHSIASASDSSMTFDIEMGDLADLEGDYTIKTTLKDANGDTLSTHNGNLDIAKETFKVTVKGVEPGTPEIKTQVKNNIISPAKDQTIKDTISYEGLEAGEKYTLSGALKNGSDESDIASTSEPVTFTAAEGGKGTEDVTFKFDASALKDGDKVVVYEYLYKGESAGSSTDDAVAKHEDLSDTNQTVTVKDGEITVTKTAGVKQAAVGDEITYTITIKNDRSVDATGYEATDKMESGLTYVSDSQNGTNDGATTTWKNLTIPANGELVITFVAKVAKDASGKVVNNVSIVEPDNPENPKGTSNDDADVTVLGAEDGTDNNDDTGSDDADSNEDDDDTAGTTTAKNDGGSSGKTIAKRTTKTGDDMPLGLIAILMGVAAAGVAVATKRRKA